MRKGFCVLGIIVSLIIVTVGILLLGGSISTRPEYTDVLDTSFATFGADFYTIVNNNIAECVTLIRLASGILITSIGALGFCLFGAFLGIKESTPSIAFSAPESVNKCNPIPNTTYQKVENHPVEKPSSNLQNSSHSTQKEATNQIASEKQTQPKPEKPVVAKPVPKPPVKKLMTLSEVLIYAGKFSTDLGMVEYLRREKASLPEQDCAKIEELLKLPFSEIRDAIKAAEEA